MILPGDEQAFLCNALAQLEPDRRPVFTARMVEHLQALADPGAGDVDRALRAALAGLWTPPADVALRPSRWDRDTPRFDLASKAGLLGKVTVAARMPPRAAGRPPLAGFPGRGYPESQGAGSAPLAYPGGAADADYIDDVRLSWISGNVK